MKNVVVWILGFCQRKRECHAGGALNFFSGRCVQPGFPKCGKNFQIWEACELKISKFGGL